MNYKLSFAIKTPKKKRVEKEKTEMVIGYIGIDINADYYVSVNNIQYPILFSCFSCKNKKIIFSTNLDKNLNRVKIIRDNSYKSKLCKFTYLPFAPGYTVKGCIVKIRDTKYFDIDELLEFSTNAPEVANSKKLIPNDCIKNDVMSFWRDNIVEIRKKQKIKKNQYYANC